MQSTLTVQQALAEGFTYCAPRNDGWTSLWYIKDLTAEDFEKRDWYLAEKESSTLQIENWLLKDFLKDHLENEESEICCDTEQWSKDALDTIDFVAITDTINQALGQSTYYKICDILLVADETA